MHYSTLQLILEYKALQRMGKGLAALKITFDEPCSSMLDSHIAVCENQVKFLDKELTPEKVMPQLTDIINAHKELNVLTPCLELPPLALGKLPYWHRCWPPLL
jgi:hypothetical protein